ncbi:MAG: hypothetical protein JWM32_1263 [Verrucomicrobia bacterium]|nr:hypothetical protein [Verrucomicrobiota bacterium]
MVMSDPNPTSRKRRICFWGFVLLFFTTAAVFLSRHNSTYLRSGPRASAEVTISYVKPTEPNVVWIDIHNGRPFSRSYGHLITDVATFAAVELAKYPGSTIVITPTVDEPYGNVVKITEECRKTRAEHIVVSIFPAESDK